MTQNDPTQDDPNTPFFLRRVDPNYTEMWSKKQSKIANFTLCRRDFGQNNLVSIHLCSRSARDLFSG